MALPADRSDQAWSGIAGAAAHPLRFAKLNVATVAPMERKGTLGLVPGGLLLRPTPILSLALLVVNDHLLKQRWPGVVTGKLSDVAGLVFFPLLLLSLIELLTAAAGRYHRINSRTAIVTALLTAIVFGSIKVSPELGQAWGDVLGWLRYPLHHTWQPVVTAHDPTDLFAVPAVALAWVDVKIAERHPRTAKRRTESR